MWLWLLLPIAWASDLSERWEDQWTVSIGEDAWLVDSVVLTEALAWVVGGHVPDLHLQYAIAPHGNLWQVVGRVESDVPLGTFEVPVLVRRQRTSKGDADALRAGAE